MLIVWSDINHEILCYEMRGPNMCVGRYVVRTDKWHWETSLFRHFDIVRDIYRYGEEIILDEAP